MAENSWYANLELKHANYHWQKEEKLSVSVGSLETKDTFSNLSLCNCTFTKQMSHY